MNTRARIKRQGMSLWETLVFTAISAVVLNLCAVTFVQSSRLATASTERAVRQQKFAEFARDFSRTVHRAARVLPGAGNVTSGGDCVVLETADGPVVAGMAGDVPAIWALEMDNGAWRFKRIETYPIGATVRFEYDTADLAAARRVTMHITGPPRKDPEDKSNSRIVVAALRIDGGAP